jgi:hypothetical protein
MEEKFDKSFELKYSIKDALESLSVKEYKVALKKIPECLGISQRTFERYLDVKATDTYSIPSDHLAALAIFFNCSMEELVNIDPRTIDIKSSFKNKNSLAASYGLTK